MRAITHQLQVQLGRHGSAAGVDHFMLDTNGVGATLERKRLDQLHATLLGRLKAHLQLVLTVLEFTVARQQVHHGLVGGEVAPHQTRLGHIDALCTVFKQHERLLQAFVLGVVQQLGIHHRTALAVKGQTQHIGRHRDFFAHNGRGLRHVRQRSRTRSRLCTGLRHIRRLVLCRRRSRRWRRSWEKRGRSAIVDLPLVP